MPMHRQGSVEINGSVDVGTCRVVLTRTATGERRLTDLYSDGNWYQMGLEPGEYDAEVEPVFAADRGKIRSTRAFHRHCGCDESAGAHPDCGTNTLIRTGEVAETLTDFGGRSVPTEI